MIKILIKPLIITSAIYAISGMYVYAQSSNDAFQPETDNSPESLQIPDRTLSKEEVRDALYELSMSISKLNERLELNNSYQDESSNRQQQLKESVADIKSELDRLTQLTAELTNETDNLAEGLDRSKKAAISRHSEVMVLIKDSDRQISELQVETASAKQAIDQNATHLDQLDVRISKLSSSVDTQVGEVEKSVEDGFLSIKSDVLFRTLAGIAFILVFAVFLFLIRRQFSTRHQVLSTEVADSSAALHNEYNNLDLKLSELLSKKLSSIDDNPNKEDHTLPMEVAAEVHRMRKRIARMPGDIKGIKPLEKALERLEDSLDNKGYEIVELLGEKYVEGLNVNPRFTVDENFEPDTQVITNVIKPQINYKDKIIQIADVEVSVGE